MERENNKQKHEQISNRQVADSGGKIIFENPTLCAQLLKDYCDMDILSQIKPEDIEDVTERFIPMFTEQRDADVVKCVHLSNDEEIFIALIEHKSGVDYNVSMQILRYMVYIWEDYEKSHERIHKGISVTKNFKYPPILPIVYYEGKDNWDAVSDIRDRIVFGDAFKEYIPGFRYHLIDLKNYEMDTLIEKENGLSLVMLINSLKTAEEFKNLHLPEDYLSKVITSSPRDVLDTIARVVAVVLRKQNVPETEIQDFVDQIKERKSMALFDDFEGFDVQEERKNGETLALIRQIRKKMKKNIPADEIAVQIEEPETFVTEIIEICEKHDPGCTSEEILDDYLLVKKD